MARTIPVLSVTLKSSPDTGVVVINVSDFDENIHEVYCEPQPDSSVDSPVPFTSRSSRAARSRKSKPASVSTEVSASTNLTTDDTSLETASEITTDEITIITPEDS